MKNHGTKSRVLSNTTTNNLANYHEKYKKFKFSLEDNLNL